MPGCAGADTVQAPRTPLPFPFSPGPPKTGPTSMIASRSLNVEREAARSPLFSRLASPRFLARSRMRSTIASKLSTPSSSSSSSPPSSGCRAAAVGRCCCCCCAAAGSPPPPSSAAAASPPRLAPGAAALGGEPTAIAASVSHSALPFLLRCVLGRGDSGREDRSAMVHSRAMASPAAQRTCRDNVHAAQAVSATIGCHDPPCAALVWPACKRAMLRRQRAPRPRLPPAAVLPRPVPCLRTHSAPHTHAHAPPHPRR